MHSGWLGKVPLQEMHEVIVLVAEMIYLSIEVLGRLSPTKDCGAVSKTIHCTAEAIATYSSTNPNMLHERQERVGDPLSGGVMMMAFMAPFRQGVIPSMLGTAGCLTSR